MNTLKVFIYLFLFISSSLFAQTPKAVESDINNAFKKIEYWGEHKNDEKINGDDSLRHANSYFQEKLNYYTNKIPTTFDQKFSITQHLIISKSDNDKLKIYSWDDETGGTMRFYKTVSQFRFGNKIFSVDLKGGLFTKIYTLKAKNKTYYLVEYFTQAMSSYFSRGIEIWAINNAHINRKLKLFKTKSGFSNTIGYAYWLDTKLKTDLLFDLNSKTLYVPVITKKEKLTGKYDRYQFTGRYFEKVKN